MTTIYELLAQRQTELEEREKELLIVVKELEAVQQELEDIRAMTNIRLLSPSEPAAEVAEPVKTKVDVSDLTLLRQEWEEKFAKS